jgi:hypothetical protein
MRDAIRARLAGMGRWTIGVLLASVVPAMAQTPPASDTDLAKQLSNPVASLVAVPLQFNWDSPVGPDKDTRVTMNLQPVVPFTLNEDWNLIVRWVMPYVAQPRLSVDAGAVPTSGLGDIAASLFFSPAKAGKFIWAVGPIIQLPGTSSPVLGSGKWSIGPTAVIAKQSGGWTYGALANQVWSFAGDNFTGGVARDDVNAMFLQPFVSYTTATAVTLGVNLEATANWHAADIWTVPMQFSASKLTRFGPFPMSVGGAIGLFLTAPGGEPDVRVRFSATILLPRGK